MPAIILAVDVLQETMAADTKKPLPSEALGKYRAFKGRFPRAKKPEGEKLERLWQVDARIREVEGDGSLTDGQQGKGGMRAEF